MFLRAMCFFFSSIFKNNKTTKTRPKKINLKKEMEKNHPDK